MSATDAEIAAKMTAGHVMALLEAIGAARSEAAAEREVAAFNCGSATWTAMHKSRADLADYRAARLSEVAAFLAAQTKEQDA